MTNLGIGNDFATKQAWTFPMILGMCFLESLSLPIPIESAGDIWPNIFRLRGTFFGELVATKFRMFCYPLFSSRR